MIYKYTEHNIMSLMQDIGMAHEDQLIKFFAAELPPQQVKHLLDKFVLRHDLNYDPKTRIYTSIGMPELGDAELQERRLLALWAVANMGSKKVIEVIPTRYPSQFFVIGVGSKSYDFTVVETDGDARLAARIIMGSLRRGLQDDTMHIAILRHEYDIKKLKNVLYDSGFDCYCCIDYETKRIAYHTFDEA